MLPRTSLTLLTALLTLTLAGSASARAGDVVYLAPAEEGGPEELFHVNAKSGAVTKLNGALVEGGEVLSFVLGSRGRQVVYRADQDTDDLVELYQVDLSKKGLLDVMQVRLNNTVAGEGVSEFSIAP